MVKDDDLVSATHGRAFWILDDLAPLRQWTDAAAKADVHLFDPSPAVRFRGGRDNDAFQGENPPAGAIVYYQLAQPQKGEITLEILDEGGRVMRKYSSREKVIPDKPLPERPERDDAKDTLPTEAGLQRVVWNLRYEEPAFLGSTIFDMGRPDMPMALPGTYQVRLNVAGVSRTAPLEVKLDPRVKTTPAELQKQFELAMQVRELFDRTHRALREIRAVRSQLQALKGRLGDPAKASSVVAAADAIDARMSPLEQELIQVKARSSQDMCNWPTRLNSKLAWLSNVVDSADRPPTQQAVELFAELKTRAEAQLGPWNELLAKELPALNELMQREGVPAVGPAPAKP